MTGKIMTLKMAAGHLTAVLALSGYFGVRLYPAGLIVLAFAHIIL